MIGIICGSGDYPRLVSQACIEKNLEFCLIILKGFCSSSGWPEVASISVGIGEIGKAIDFLHQHKVKKIIFAGAVKRPNFRGLTLDSKGKSWLLQLGKSLLAGDDALLSAVSNLALQEGFETVAGTSLLDDIFFSPGIYSCREPTKADRKNIDIGLLAATELGISDAGQSVVVRNGKVIGKEDAHGTNALLEKYGKERGSGRILVKIAKPQQDERLDLPTIGIETIDALHKNGFDGIVIEADRCIALNKEDIIARANELNIFIMAVKPRCLKVFLIAGEASGDYLGGKLMESIGKIFNGRVEFFGVGGQCMAKAGLRKLFSIDELSIIGIWEVVGKIFRLKNLITETVQKIVDYQPDVVVTIDSSGFTHRIAKKIKKIVCKIPIVHYVAPPVWAWRGWRAKSMPKFIDKIITLFPFEPAYFEKYGLKSVFVGHPIAEDVDFDKPPRSKLQNFLNSNCKIKEKDDYKVIILLPGSRKSEILFHLPLLEEFTELTANKYKNVKFIIPTVESLEKKINDMTHNWAQKPIVVTTKTQKTLAYYVSDVAVAASGSVTLELARVGLPFVTIYKTSCITYLIVKLLINVKNVCLVNLLNKKNIVPELLQNNCTAENIFNSVQKILTTNEFKKQKESFKKVMEILRGNQERAARETILTALENQHR